MKKYFLTLAIFIFITLNGMKIIDLDPEGSMFDLTDNKVEGFTLDLGFSEIQSNNIRTADGEYTIIRMAGLPTSRVVGEPELPVLRKIFTTPENSEMKIHCTSFKAKEIDLIEAGITNPLYPAQSSVSKSEDPSLVEFQIKEDAYRVSGFTELPAISWEYVGSVRGTDLYALEVEIVQYDPPGEKLKVFEQLTLDVEFTNTNNSSSNYSDSRLSFYFDSVLRKTVLNYPIYENRDELTRYPVKYVIISDPIFEEQLQPFIEWKTKKGFNVITCYTDDPEVGNTPVSIKAYIQNLYDSATPDDPAPSFLLIVGDVDQVPAWDGNTGGHVTDLNYVKLDGNNYIPDMYFGRFSANNAAQLQPQIDKTLMYEKYLMSDPSYLDEVVMIAGVDANYAPIYGNGQINYGTNHYFNLEHGLTSHTYLYPESGSSDYQVIQNVSDGVSYINYTAHGYDQGWGDPSFTVNDINTLQNFEEFCLAVGNCCLTNKFDVQTCFGEAWLRADNKGAIGYIGGTNNTFWDEDFWWGVGAGQVNVDPQYSETGTGVYDGLFHDNNEDFSEWHTTTGAMNFCGNMAVVEADGWANYYWEIYSLMGDPSLEAYLGVPEINSATYPEVIIIGQTSIEITAEPYSYAALTFDGEILGSVLIEEDGSSVMELAELTEPGSAQIVITRQNRQPVIDDIDIIPDGSYIVVADYEISDEANGEADYGEMIGLDVTFYNAGNMNSGEVNVTVTSDDGFIELISSDLVLPDLEAGSSHTVEDAVTIEISDSVPDQHLVELVIWISGEGNWQSQIQFTCNAPQFSIGPLIVEDDENGVLDPGETAYIRVPIENTGHSVSQEIESVLTTPDGDLVQITDATDTMAGLDPNYSGIAEFMVTVFEDIEPGTPVNFDFEAVSGEYSASAQFITSVGNVVEDFETGDLLSYPWQHGGDESWQITENAFQGGYAVQAGDLENSEESVLRIQFEIPVGGQLSFWRKVSSENGQDKLSFYLDGDELAFWSGEVDWSMVMFEIPAGEHQIEWIYSKDQHGTSGNDTAWLDMIIFPSAGITFPPLLHVDPSLIEVTADIGEIISEVLQARNIGGEPLEFTINITGNTEWLSISQTGGYLESGESEEIDIEIDPSDLENGQYTSAVMFDCDNGDFKIIPVVLNVINTDSDENEIPLRTELLGNYPNPFNPATVISFTLTEDDAMNARLEIYNIKGQKVKTFTFPNGSFDTNENISPSLHLSDSRSYSLTWNGTDDNDQSVPSGLYFYRLKAGDFDQSKKMLLLK